MKFCGMPLFPRLYMKKSRQYNVVSKQLMVIRVELLDGTPVECTLSSESSGQECLDNVCQRFGIKQPKFFGLKYCARRSPPLRRWLDLDRPLKKQLDRYAESKYLHLGVMFYVSDIAALQDEMTRTQYFLQLKNDVLECRLHCKCDQAVMLASYSLQAELGDFDADRHSQYIREFSLFPKHMMLDEELREKLTDAALQSHAALRGLSQQLAEVYYIMEAQQLEGYGQEHFVCRDDSGNGVLVGASLTGIVVRQGGDQPPTFYRWADITNLHNQKRNFGIELSEKRTANFVMDDKELAKYVWKVCVHQHKFFDTNRALLAGKPAISQLPPPDIQASSVPRALPEAGRASPFAQEQTSYHPEASYLSEQSTAGDLHYGLISNYSQPHSESSWSLAQQQQQQHQQQQQQQLEQQQKQQQLEQQKQQQQRQQQEQQQRLEQQQQEQQQQQLSTSRALLPQYRQAPDYDTAVKQMYSGGAAPAPAEPPAAYMYRSQPEIHHLETDVIDFSQYRNYADLSHLPSFGYLGNGAAVPALPSAGDLINSSVHTYSTPELASQSLGDAAAEPVMTSELQLYQVYKPPPPYPYSRLASSSTPDLASATVQVSRSSPDLVSRKNRLNQPRGAAGLSRQAHRTYENLADTVAYSPQAAFSSEELDRVYSVGPASVSAQFVTQSAVVPEIARSQPADAPAAPPSASGPAPGAALLSPPAAGVDPQGPGSPSHFLGGNIRVGTVGPAPAATADDEPIYENVEFIQRGRAYTGCSTGSVPGGGGGGGSSGGGVSGPGGGGTAAEPALPTESRWSRGVVPPRDIPIPAAAMQEIGIGTPTHAPTASNSSTLEKRRRKRWGGGSSGDGTPPEQAKSNTLRRIKETFSRSFGESPRIRTSGGSGSGLGLNHGAPDVVVKRETTAIPREQRCQAIEARISDPAFFREFEAVVKKRETADYTTARRPENENRNRFKDVLPYEDNRVRVTPSRDNPHGYINASQISVTMGSQQRFYLAAQGPLATTVLHFWQAVWENNVHLIVMLTDATRGHDRAYPYWPQQDNTSVECDQFTISRSVSTPSRAYVTSRLVVTERGSRKSRVVWHLQYTDWADHGCPEDAAGFVEFVEELGMLRQTSASEMAVAPGGSRNTPVLVHCSAGVGRTGVTIMCDVLLHCLDHNLEVDVPKLLHHLRQQRMLMVQTVTQYKFVYQVLAHYLKRSRLI